MCMCVSVAWRQRESQINLLPERKTRGKTEEKKKKNLVQPDVMQNFTA